MAADLAAPPVLSTPDDSLLQAATPAECASRSRESDEALQSTFETARTAAEIAEGGWRRVALQFPDDMLVDAPRVVELLQRAPATAPDTRFHIMADTSYSACCVDEVAAEHVDAQVVVHYGRACLSPTSRLPVIYVYTSHALDHEAVLGELESALGGDRAAKAVVMADLRLQNHVDSLVRQLRGRGYGNVVATEVVRDPAAVIPNRRLRGASGEERDRDRDRDREPGEREPSEGGPGERELAEAYALLHLGDPPASLLLALKSRFASLRVLAAPRPGAAPAVDDPTARTAGLLRRRFARVLSLASAGVVGILVNTLSVSNYLASVELLRAKIAQAGKKSYTVVVGKLNPAKLANFAEVEGWVVVGCWESGLVEDDAAYWRPVVTPFELEVALTGEERRTWGGEWWGGIEGLKPETGGDGDGDGDGDAASTLLRQQQQQQQTDGGADGDDGDDGDDDESLPPEFDLRTGRLVSHSRPMRLAVRSAGRAAAGQQVGAGSGSGPGPGSGPGSGPGNGNAAVARRAAAGQLASIRGVASPGAEFLRSQRTWQGLGSDFDGGGDGAAASTALGEGRGGIARGYRVLGGGDDGEEGGEEKGLRR